MVAVGIKAFFKHMLRLSSARFLLPAEKHERMQCEPYWVVVFLRFGGTMPLFLFIYFYINRADIQYFFIYTTGRVPSCYPHCFCSVEGLLWGPEPRFELGPAVQQADALLSEPRRTLGGRFCCCEKNISIETKGG